MLVERQRPRIQLTEILVEMVAALKTLSTTSIVTARAKEVMMENKTKSRKQRLREVPSCAPRRKVLRSAVDAMIDI